MVDAQIPSPPPIAAPWAERQRQTAVDARERARRRAVNLLFVIYLIVMLDGVLRKYVFPGAERPLIFLQDPFVLYLYFHALRHGFVRKSAFLAVGSVLFVLGVLIVLLRSFVGDDDSLLLSIFGLRQYFFFIPLAFVIASVFSQPDLYRFFRLNMILLILMAPLMIAQVVSSPDSWVNTGQLLDSAPSLGNGYFGDFIRAPGFFTTAYGPTFILPLDGAILLLLWMMPPRERPCSRLLFVLTAFALFVAIAASGNRGAIVGLMVVGAAACLLPLLMPGARAAVGGVTATATLTVAAVATFVNFFPAQYNALYERWVDANAGQGDFQIVDRAVAGFFYFLQVIPHTPTLGFGLGLASNGANILGVNSSLDTLSMLSEQLESDWSRHILDLGPIVGICYIAFRIALTARLGLLGISAATRNRNPIPWLMFAAVGYIIFNGLLTSQSTTTALSWFAVGLIFAAPNYVRRFR